MDFRLLGPLEVEAEGRVVTPTRARERAVLAVLLLRAGRVVATEELIDAVWGEAPPATARTALQGMISSLRRALGADRIETRGAGYRLALRPGDRHDLAMVEELTGAAGGEGPAARARLLGEALSLFRGAALAEVELMGELEHERIRIDELRIGTEEALVAAELELGRHAAVIARLERLVGEQPLREGLRTQLMLALYRAGRQADALRVAQDVRRVLATELGVEPGPTLQQLERQVLDQDPQLMEDSFRAVAEGAAAGAAAGSAASFLATDSSEPDVRQRIRAVAARIGGFELSSPRGTVLGFVRARDAAATAAALQRSAVPGRGLRIGIHSTTRQVDDQGVSATLEAGVDHALRLATLAHPGQVVLSADARDLLREAPLHEVDARELGKHRLSDLGPAQALYQLVALGLVVDFPPIDGVESRPTNLPVQPTPLIGRRDEVRQIVALLRDPELRLVTLTGPGGTGKTRLAVHVAAELLDDAPDGTWFVGLDALADPALVAPTIAATIGIEEDTAAGSPVESLVGALRHRQVLLVLDNFEHILGAADVVARVLALTTSVKVLVTSRVPLRLAEERQVPIPPLEAPPAVVPSDIGDLLAVASVALFVARARAVRADFAITVDNASAVAAVCRAVDGLPLAVELAASQVGLMDPAQLLERLDHALRRVARSPSAAPERHRALQATIDWSHGLLDEDSRGLFADLAVFAGGWTLDAAESVCGGRRDVIGGLAKLVDHSLIGVDGTDAEPRFGMLETIREYAAGRLEASARRAELEARHAVYFQALADSAEPHLRGNPGPWIARLESEHDNIRAALDRLARAGDGASLASLAGSLWRFWYLAGHLAEGRSRLEHALAVHPEPTTARARVLIGAAVMAVNTGDPETARRHATEAIALSRDLGDAWGAAYGQFMLGAALGNLGDDDGARSAEETALQAFRELGDEHTALLVSRNLAGTLEDLGDRAAAAALYHDNLRRAREESNGRLEATSLGALSIIAFDEGRVADAILLLLESLRVHRQLADRLDTAVDLSRAIPVLAMAGEPGAAARLLGALGAIRGQLGARGRRVARTIEATAPAIRRQMGPDDYEELLGAGRALGLEEALELAIASLSRSAQGTRG